ncbi:MAG: universal stress protein [Gammaproteobacteria bacterium]|nr:universal stress protein [Gammaproteobacteria bacterium]NIR90058.1 universal stress protein [Gammaproteobacteria bacterium]NIU03262.1 universal stress protein [Gammaproteobacteria bacterium]NIV50756.1 universal stress protein [Gammaproteobacteria bacterium]NIV75342.1 universal stress protein [Gammaproteobacteria bacterium]
MIPTIQTILYATDLAPQTYRVFRHALALAQRHDAKIVLLHVIEPLGPTGESLVRNVISDEKYQELKRSGLEQLHQEIHTRLERFCQEELGKHADEADEMAEIRVVQGQPAAVILREAENVDADVIVMGTHGYSRVARAFLGSVANKVLQHTRTPVFVVPLRANGEAPQ